MVGVDAIAAAIRQARTAQGWTQKELGERVGIPQSHLSKIEKGRVDLKLSSLIEIARALDLELQLVSRKALPAVELSLKAAEALEHARRARALIAQALKTSERVHSEYPQIEEGYELHELLRELLRKGINPRDFSSLEAALRPVRTLRGALEAGSPGGVSRVAEEAVTVLRAFRNAQAHKAFDGQRPRPAYRLGEDEA